MVKLDPREALRQSEERYQKMIEEVVDYAIILLDEDGIILNWNKGAERIKGYRTDEIIGKSFKNFYRKEDRDTHLPEYLLQKARDEGRATQEGWRVRKDGSQFWGSITITSLHSDDGTVIGFSKVTRDLTEKKIADDALRQYAESLERTNEELKKSEERYHRMIDEVQDYAILMLDPNGIIQNWNKGAERIKGYRSEEVVGRSFRLFYIDEDRDAGLPEKILNKAKTEGRAQHEGWRVRKDGSRFWGHIVLTALHDEKGEIMGYTKMTRDLTEKKEAEDKMNEYSRLLEKKNAELEQFAYVASHDIKEPLRKIIAFGDLLQHHHSESLDEQGKHYVQRMQNASHRMMQLIENLLEFSRIDRSFKTFERVDLKLVVDDVVHDLEMNIREKHAVVHVGKMPVILARPMQMQQLFQNLISNSLKFNISKKPEVSVTTEIKQDENGAQVCLIAVKDNGIGFGEEYKEKIFEIFQRLQGLSEYPGTGIGLAICKKIVEAHNGSIWAESEEGEGATFYVTLPCEQNGS